MSHTSRRTRFIPSLLVRLVAVSAALSMGLAAALFIPAPVIASAPPAADIEPVTMRPRVVAWAEETANGPKQIAVKIEVRDERGEIVMAPTVVTSPGVPFEVISGKTVNGSETSTRVRGEVDSSYDGEVVVTWEENGRVLRSETARIVRREAAVSTSETQGEPISLHLDNAELHDVLRTFSALTGKTITAAPELSGRVTIDVKDMPWMLALSRVAAQLGLSLERTPDDGVRLVRRTEPTLPPGAHRVEGDVKAPRIVSRVAPRYPEAARRANVAGMVIIEVVIDERGNLVDARVLKPLPHGLAEAALDAVRQWTFEPGTLDGVPVKTVFNLTINFKPE